MISRAPISAWAAALLAAVVTSSARADTLALWTFESSLPATAGPFAPEVGSGQASAYHSSPSVAYTSTVGNGSAHSFSANHWNAGDYFQFALPTTGFDHLTLSWDQTRSSTAPSDFAVQYSLDGSSFTTLLPSYAVLLNAAVASPSRTMWGTYSPRDPAYTMDLDLAAIPEINNAPQIVFRLTANAAATNATGTNRVDNFLVVGQPFSRVALDAASPADAAYVTGTQSLPAPDTSVQSLDLRAGATLTMYAGDILTAPGGLTIEPGATLEGSGTVVGNVLNRGTIHVLLGSHQQIVNTGTATFGASGGGGGSYSVGGYTNSAGAAMTFLSPGAITAPVSNAGTQRFFNGLFTFDGTFTQTDTGRTIFDLRGYTQCDDYSFLHVTSTAALEGVFQANLLDGFVPHDGSTFDIFQADGGITFGPAGLNFDLPEGFTWALTHGDTMIELTYHGVPEPATLAVLGLGAAALLIRRRR